ncbi:MAG: aspartate aminotransferase family protein [Clostridiales Family XIII bacterium]|jgi:glutamate-1-semialdehyde 2,1-aminomutase|nr:aspartate aminotransferase family protein [Clostridiales Family XIII bacterium]
MDINRGKLVSQYQKEIDDFKNTHPKSGALYQRAKDSLLQGVPMNWMTKWAGSYPVFVAEAKGAHFTDVDGNTYLDLCLGDTGSMIGHASEPAVAAITEYVKQGTTFMLPTEDAIWVGEELGRRFGMKYWQFSTSATDANRFALRLAREVTKRPMVVVYNWCYHGTVDETVAVIDEATGKTVAKPGSLGPQVDPSKTTRVIEWNDVPALEDALKTGDVAAVLAEPVMTNCGIVHPAPGYHEQLRALTKKYGTLLIIDETHTLCTGIGGYTKEYALKPDMVVVGKTIAAGIPTAAYGFTEELGKKVADAIPPELCDIGGIGGTLAANALSMHAMKAVLSEILTEAFYAKSIPLATRFNAGVQRVIDEYDLPWNTTQLGCRTEYWFRRAPAVNGGEAEAAVDFELDQYMHLASLNRGILMTPFHNMALISAPTTEADIDRHTEVFREIVQAIL